MKLLFLILFPFCVAAQQDVLHIIQVQGELSVSEDQFKQMYRKASWYFREMGLVLRLRRTVLNDNPCEDEHSISSIIPELACLRNYAIDRGWYPARARTMNFFLLPPWLTENESGKTAWIGGIVYALCNNFGIGNASAHQLVDGVFGPDRLPHSAVVLAHETAHMLCAKHEDKTINLMHPDANAYTSAYKLGRLPVLRTTKRAVQRAINRKRKYGLHS